MELFWIILAIIIVYLAVVNWPITLGIIVLSAAIYLGQKQMAIDREKREKELEAERIKREKIEKERLAHERVQIESYEALVTLCDKSLDIFESMPNYLMTTEELLDQAEADFNERAYAPFWDSVESAATKLGQYDESVRELSENANKYNYNKMLYESTPPDFPINLRSVKSVKIAQPSNERLHSIVRTAQKDFEFATIYEQRKANQLLVAGFTNLAQALDGMGHRISSSIDILSEQVSIMSSTIDSLGNNISESLNELQNTMQEHSSAIIAYNEENLDRHEQALEMLDNIQRRRKPRPAGYRDNAY